MMLGEFDWSHRRARINLEMHGRGRRHPRDIPALVDTAFNGQLALTENQIAYLRPERAGPLLPFTLADGQTRQFVPYWVTVDWEGVPRNVIAVETGDHALIGFGMLLDHSLWIGMIRGGRVMIQRI